MKIVMRNISRPFYRRVAGPTHGRCSLSTRRTAFALSSSCCIDPVEDAIHVIHVLFRDLVTTVFQLSNSSVDVYWTCWQWSWVGLMMLA
jgi:hypothetical protein